MIVIKIVLRLNYNYKNELLEHDIKNMILQNEEILLENNNIVINLYPGDIRELLRGISI